MYVYWMRLYGYDLRISVKWIKKDISVDEYKFRIFNMIIWMILLGVMK